MTTTSSTHHSTRSLALAALAGAQLLIGLDYNIVFVALPDIASLGFTDGSLQWVVSAYAIAFGGLLLLGGRLTDLIGRRKLFFVGLGLFAAGSALGAAAPAGWVLIVGRAVQGAGGAALAPATLALLGTLFAEGAARNRAIGVWGAAGASGMVLGSIVGGLLTDSLGWRAVLAVNLPLVGLIAAAGAYALPPQPGVPARGRLDVPGALLTSISAMALVLGFASATEDGWGAPTTIGAIGISAGAAIVLLLVERRAGNPIIDIALLRHRPLAVATGSTFLFMAGFGATAYFLTLYFQQTRGLDARTTGLVFVVPCAGVLIGTAVGSHLATRTGLRSAMVVGQSVGLAGTLLFAALIEDDAPWGIVLALAALFSIGQGIVFTTMFAAATTGIAENHQGSASGIATTGQQLGGAIGLAVLVNIVSRSTSPGITVSMYAISGIIATGLLVSLALPRSAGRHSRTQPPQLAERNLGRPVPCGDPLP